MCTQWHFAAFPFKTEPEKVNTRKKLFIHTLLERFVGRWMCFFFKRRKYFVIYILKWNIQHFYLVSLIIGCTIVKLFSEKNKPVN